MRLRARVADRARTRRRCIAVVFAALVVLTHAETTTKDEGEGGAVAASRSGAIISVFDAFGVVGHLGWWGVDKAMETAGYGELY